MRWGLILVLTGCVTDTADAGPDATMETSTPDVVTDSGVDGGTSFCTGKPYDFCADFDLSPNVEMGWSLGKNEKLGGTIASDQTSYVSPPFSAASKIPTFSNGTPYTYSATLGHVVDLKGKTSSRLTVDVYPKLGPVLSGDCVVYLGMALNGIGGIIIMQRRLADAGATEWLTYRTLNTTSAPHFMSSGLAITKWNHVVEEVHWATDNTGTIKVTIDGNVALDVSGIPTTQEMMLQTVKLNIGLNNCSTSAQQSTVDYDNAFAEILP